MPGSPPEEPPLTTSTGDAGTLMTMPTTSATRSPAAGAWRRSSPWSRTGRCQRRASATRNRGSVPRRTRRTFARPAVEEQRQTGLGGRSRRENVQPRLRPRPGSRGGILSSAESAHVMYGTDNGKSLVAESGPSSLQAGPGAAALAGRGGAPARPAGSGAGRGARAWDGAGRAASGAGRRGVSCRAGWPGCAGTRRRATRWSRPGRRRPPRRTWWAGRARRRAGWPRSPWRG